MSQNNATTMIAPLAEATTRISDFWRGQDKVIDCMQGFALGWFERRHADTKAALESARRMCTARTPADAAREFQEWASGSLQRAAQDGVAFQREIMAIGEAMIDASHHYAGA
jgi:hypothetical protein